MKKPEFVSKKTWKSMTWKEQDFLVLLCERKYTKQEMKRMLYITTDVGYWKLRRRVQEKINKDL